MSCHRSPRSVLLAYVLMILANIIYYHYRDNIDYPTAFSPVSLTFVIWVPIFIFELFLVIYQRNVNAIQGRPWIILSFLLNTFWLTAVAFQYWWLSAFISLTYAMSLTCAYNAMYIDYNNNTPFLNKFSGYTGISMNLAWVVVITLLNTVVALYNSNVVGKVEWATACIACTTIIAIYRLVRSGDIPYGIATGWAIGGIYYMHKDNSPSMYCSLASICILAFCIVLRLAIRPNKPQSKDSSVSEDYSLFV